jgi:hypothetical protein
MDYQSHHCSAILLCSTCISVFLLESSCTFCSSALSLHAHLCLFVHLFFYISCSFFSLHSMCCASYILLWSSALPPSTLCKTIRKKAPLFSLFYMFLSRQVLCEIIHSTLHLLWCYIEYVPHQWLILRLFSFSSSATLHLISVTIIVDIL